jgi:hypothetical protein
MMNLSPFSFPQYKSYTALRRFPSALLLGVQVRQVFDLLPVAEYLVQEVDEQIDEQILVELRAEEQIKANIGKRINVFFLAMHPVKITNGG